MYSIISLLRPGIDPIEMAGCHKIKITDRTIFSKYITKYVLDTLHLFSFQMCSFF